jgi:hypothetical protein
VEDVDLVAAARRIFADGLPDGDDADPLEDLLRAYLAGASDVGSEISALAHARGLRVTRRSGVVVGRTTDGRVAVATWERQNTVDITSTRRDVSDRSDESLPMPVLGAALAPACTWHGGSNCPRRPGRPFRHRYPWQAARCATCGANPDAAFSDGSPRFACRHLPGEPNGDGD